MCGIAGAVGLRDQPVRQLDQVLTIMSALLVHRGPDGHGYWQASRGQAGLAHRRLAIIDLSSTGHQPMKGPNGTVITYNGQIYNYRELMDELKPGWPFRSRSDTETILAAYEKWGRDCLDHLRGMFAFALWDGDRLFAARDPFGIKPFYYAIIDDVFYFASEIKALLPVLPEIATDPEALAEYLTFQYTIGEASLFKHVNILPPGHALVVENAEVRTFRYWNNRPEVDHDHSADWLIGRMAEVLEESVALHLRADVPVGAYVSGGIDSTLVAMLAARHSGLGRIGFHGKFTDYPGYDESRFAEVAADEAGLALHETTITAEDFRDTIERVVYHLDQPVAGPGSFPQYITAALAARHVKVVLGGQGGDEIFGGYARYLVAYLEQCIRGAIEGNRTDGEFAVSFESLLPNLTVLQEYKPLMRQFFARDFMGPFNRRYFALIDRSVNLDKEINWSSLDRKGVFERYSALFDGQNGAKNEGYFEAMTQFDFKCLLPALLHVEDRVSMAHGLESRVPLLDAELVNFVATVPASLKFKNGELKHLLKAAFNDALPREIALRRDKMGFPVPLAEWFAGSLKGFVGDVFLTQRTRHRPYFDSNAILANFEKGERFSRNAWGLLNLELWHQIFHDRASEYRRMLAEAVPETIAAQ